MRSARPADLVARARATMNAAGSFMPTGSSAHVRVRAREDAEHLATSEDGGRAAPELLR
jgi:hypothetical protein